MLTQPQFWLYGQSIWLLLAIGYNLTSIIRLNMGEAPLIEGTSLRALVGLIPFALVIIAGWSGKQGLWLWLGLILLPGLVYIGVWRHIEATLLPGGMDVYAGSAAWGWAIAINVWGSLALLLGSISLFRSI